MGRDRISSISRSETLEGMGEFWDAHDFTECDTDAPDMDLRVTCAVPIEADLLSSVEKEARKRGVSAETLVNLWLQEKLMEHARPAPL
ncbi:MAG: hypothetical protein HY321_19515 [Armatimonadetes bacterium]|nr:hypothetical protein [Armatimonadota bacterium]